MSINLEQLKEVFLEESFEGLSIMEKGILSLDIESPDQDEINTIFRAIHSIKGGAGTFGFDEITNLAHTFENILDDIRNQKRNLTNDINDTFLSSIDALTGILNCYQAQQEVDETTIQKITDELNAILGESPAKTTKEPLQENEQLSEVTITFQPEPDILASGNEPIRFLREISHIATCDVSIAHESIPSIDDDLQSIKLIWTIKVTGEDLDLEEIQEVFEWIEDDCVILKFETKKNQSTPTTNTEKTAKKEKQTQTKTQAKTKVSTSIRVDTNKIDDLVNLVGELVITESMLEQYDSAGNVDTSKLKETLSTLNRQMRDLQEAIITVRMVPVETSFNRIPRIIRDTSKALGKKINLHVSGENTEVDKTVSEKLTDPLVHIIRNAVDHGIESGKDRLAAGKTEEGNVFVSAYHQGGNLFIDIQDDGNGINTQKVYEKAIEKGVITKESNLTTKEINELIFAAGFSTADAITDVSGRGVGMDVVRSNIESLKGSIELFSELGKGSTFRIKLPLTLAILDGQLARVGEQTFIFPILSILESIQIKEDNIKSVQGHSSLYRLRDEYIPIINLFEKFRIDDHTLEQNKQLLVIVEHNGSKAALKISELLSQQQVVIKNLEQNFRVINGFSGATILGDGTVSLILDLASIIETSKKDLSHE